MSDISNYLPLWGQWNTEALIGEGADSRVYRAVRTAQDGQEYAAIKHIFVAPTEDPSLSERRARALLAQADRQIALRGKKHLVEYYERQAYHRADGGYDVFVRMELLTSLRSVMGKTEFTDAMYAQLGQDVCRALLALEEADACHGAIHPSNIFLSRDGTYKLGDYCRNRARTTNGSTREFVAPEVLTGSSLPSVGSDRYALGMVLYRLSNGLRGPFLPPVPTPVTREDMVQADRRRLRGEALPDAAYAGSRLTAILQRACAAAPENRYPTTEAMLHDFELLQEPEAEIEAPAPVTKEPTQKEAKQTKKNPAFIAGIVVACAVLIGGAIAGTVLVKSQQAKKQETETTAAVSEQTQEIVTTAAPETAAAVTTQATEPVTTEAPTTEAPTTEAPATEAPTEAPTTPPAAATYSFNISSTYNFVDFTVPASGYILADSDTRYITADDLAGMTKNQVRIACNEIFARKGRIFQSATMRDYFTAMPWYNGTVEGSYFDSHQNEFLTEIEQANARTIVQYERSKGWD